MKAASPSQVTVTVYHSFLKILEIIREFEDQGCDKHPSIASEHIKQINHNQPYKEAERIENKVKDTKVKFNDHVTKTSDSLKELN